MSTALSTDTLPFPYFVASEDQQILYLNDKLREYLSPDSLHKYIKEVFDEWQPVRKDDLVRTVLNKQPCLFIKEPVDEERVMYAGFFSKGIVGLLDELEELKQANRHLDAIIESSYDGIYITDKDGITLKTNSAIERITGIPKEYYINKNVADLMKRGILQTSVSEQVVEKKKPVSVIQLNYSGRETLMTGSPIFNEDGEVESVVTNIRDLSDLNELQSALQQANEMNKSYQKEIERLKGRLSISDKDVVIESEQMRLIYDTAGRIANVEATVLILGETGVGKDVLAKYIYQHSERSRAGKFIKVNCGAIPPDLLESELFGYSSGAFTGANKQGKPGMFELADKGVLFLDEIGEMPLNLQVKLLRVIQEREIQRVGSTTSKMVDVRLIAATNRNLKKMVQNGEFREDLFYRLNVVPVHIPPLRERKEEILPLLNVYLKKLNKKYGLAKQLNEELKAFFYQYDWPGNVRELSNLLERIVLLNRENMLGLEHLPAEYQAKPEPPASSSKPIMTLKQAAEEAEQHVLRKAAEKYKTTYEIAEALETSQPTVVRKMKKYGIKIEI
ncbi:sigma-54 interaction domain-containing protein [Bacillus thermotolerans]|uniref:HTH-type transcriptional regulatory protein TyrR n=1 Tax=Bacillus thermotolerans TaxID=1221996 RepID=A0A0F5HJD7_BACTR|nr:sigma 54-interacting transcriptional regulator [Bacillus thermotolerans]KKB33426.1 Response regulator of zinc sigma-54-dependent two-component system [Bacillus thermotolerans]KKB42857.1 Response regulator of zinc sigma-54-dependent two-component system [Bacillus thermotolerans]